MADAAIRLEQQRLQLMASLTAAAETLRSCANAAEAYANVLKQVSVGADAVESTTGASDAAGKSRKRKSSAVEDPAEGGKRKRKPRVKDPNAPKRPASSYIIFQNEVRKQMKESHPDMSNNELIQLISQQWAGMNESEKAIYHQAMESAKERYSADKKAYDNRTPEEIAAANAAVAQLAAAKRSRKSKNTTETPAPAPPAATSPDSDSSEESESEEETPAPKRSKSKSSREEDEDEEAEDESESDSDEEPPKPAPKKAPSPPPKKARNNKKANKA
ncbi:hypothetical protein AX16_001818 [Volvariella volvacea WC 439]|nr:hypothetical protein AX16_001818 [Volvariella volvacea WC 439]